jgi:hypothetical protein
LSPYIPNNGKLKENLSFLIVLYESWAKASKDPSLLKRISLKKFGNRFEPSRSSANYPIGPSRITKPTLEQFFLLIDNTFLGSVSA